MIKLIRQLLCKHRFTESKIVNKLDKNYYIIKCSKCGKELRGRV